MLQRQGKQSVDNDDGHGKGYLVRAASPPRGHPGGDQRPFQFLRRRFGSLRLDAHLVCLGTGEGLEEAVEVEQHKSEVRSGVILWSLSLRRSGFGKYAFRYGHNIT